MGKIKTNSWLSEKINKMGKSLDLQKGGRTEIRSESGDIKTDATKM